MRRAALALLIGLPASPAGAQVTSTFLYTLSNFSGPLRYDWVRLSVDQERGETYVLYQNVIRVFNPNGMEIFSFGDDLDVGQIVDVAVNAAGDILVLSHKGGKPLVTRCNYRGVPLEPFTLTKLPAGIVFEANRLIRRNGLLYFVSLNSAMVTITDEQGAFQRQIDLLSALDAEDRNKSDTEVMGFTVDGEGSIFFTIPTLFRVYKLAADGTVSSFGRPGSAAGRFGVIAGIAVDSRGNLLVADKLKCVVMVFDKAFTFLREFGYRGARPENLIVPDDLAVDAKDRLYVSQGRRRGVSVFALAN